MSRNDKTLPFLNVGIIEDISEFLFCGFTDGLTEIKNSKGEEFGDTELLKVITANADKNPTELNDVIIREMEHFKGKNNFKDDITIFTCRINTSDD